MATVNGIFKVTGSLQNVSFYSIKGSDKVYMRTKGGPTARRMKVGPEFALVRKHQAEWKGCVLFSQRLKMCLDSIYRMRDFNVAPVLNGIAKTIMKLDTENEIGKRSIMLSEARETLEGFNLNRQFPFNSVFRTSIHVEIDKKQGQMKVEIPRIVTANDLYNVQKLPFFRLVFNLTLFSDLKALGDNASSYYTTKNEKYAYNRVEQCSEWFSANDIISAQTHTLEFNFDIPEESAEQITALGSVGIEFGNTAVGGKIEPVKHACCAKIISVV
jgi:hypothetical protein